MSRGSASGPDVVSNSDGGSHCRTQRDGRGCGGGIFTGVGAGVTAILIPIDLWFEKGFYIGRILTFVTALGPTMQITNLSLPTPKAGWPVMPEDLHPSTTQYGAAARFGLDFYLGPDWSLRTEAVARVPLNASSYSESDNKPIPAALAQRSDYLATIGLNLGITKVF